MRPDSPDQLQQPLLAKPLSRTKAAFNWIIVWIEQWCIMSTNISFLQSKVSRRHLWSVTVPLFFGLMVLFDGLIQDWNTLPWDAIGFIAIWGITLIMPRASLWNDALISLVLVLNFMITIRYESQVQLAMFAVCTEIFLGVHTCAVASTGFMLLLQCSFYGIGTLATNTILLLLATSWSLYLECITTKVHSSQLALESFVDNGTDGFCTINVGTGQVTSASSSLKVSFGNLDLVGEVLANFLKVDDKDRFETLLDASSRNCFSSILVTFQLLDLSRAFDCRVVTYEAINAGVGVCFFIQGETRAMTNAIVTPVVSAHTKLAMESVVSGDQDLEQPFAVKNADDGDQTWRGQTVPQQPIPTVEPIPYSATRHATHTPHITRNTHRGRDRAHASSSCDIPKPRLEGAPRVPSCAITPLSTREFCMLEWIRCWNNVRGQCCPLHENIDSIAWCLNKIKAMPCNPMWAQNAGEQCPKCGILWDEDDDSSACVICGCSSDDREIEIVSNARAQPEPEWEEFSTGCTSRTSRAKQSAIQSDRFQAYMA